MRKMGMCMLGSVLLASWAFSASIQWKTADTKGALTDASQWEGGKAPGNGDRIHLDKSKIEVVYDENAESAQYRGFRIAATDGTKDAAFYLKSGTLQIGDSPKSPRAFDVAGGVGSSAKVYVSGGSLNLTKVGDGLPDMNLGAGAGSAGEFVISGGIVTVGRNVNVGSATGGKGKLVVLGGEFIINGSLQRNPKSASTQVDVHDGRIIIKNTDWVSMGKLWMAKKWLTAYNAEEGAVVDITYNGTDTIITAKKN